MLPGLVHQQSSQGDRQSKPPPSSYRRPRPSSRNFEIIVIQRWPPPSAKSAFIGVRRFRPAALSEQRPLRQYGRHGLIFGIRAATTASTYRIPQNIGGRGKRIHLLRIASARWFGRCRWQSRRLRPRFPVQAVLSGESEKALQRPPARRTHCNRRRRRR